MNKIIILLMCIYFAANFFILNKLYEDFKKENQTFYDIYNIKNIKIQERLGKLNKLQKEKQEVSQYIEKLKKNSLMNKNQYEKEKQNLLEKIRNEPIEPIFIDEECINIIKNKIHDLKKNQTPQLD